MAWWRSQWVEVQTALVTAPKLRSNKKVCKQIKRHPAMLGRPPQRCLSSAHGLKCSLSSGDIVNLDPKGSMDEA